MELQRTPEEEPRVTLADSNAAYDDLSNARQQATVSVNESVSPGDVSSPVETGYTAITSEVNDIEGVANEIPGLSVSTQDDGLSENMAVFPKGLMDLDDANEEKFTNLVGTPIDSDGTPIELAQSLSTDRSEELSPKAAITGMNSMNSSTATSVGLLPQLVLPKISAPLIHLADEQKDQLQQLAFARIIDAYKQVTIAGGSQVRFSILAHSRMEVNTGTHVSQYLLMMPVTNCLLCCVCLMQFLSELDPWKLLKTHILSDYVNHEVNEYLIFCFLWV